MAQDAAATFGRFSELPTEVRLMIWKCSLPSTRFVSLGAPSPVPNTLHINSESRAVALKHYELAFGPSPGFGQVYFGQPIYFDFEVDVLHIPALDPKIWSASPLDISRVKRFSLDTENSSPRRVGLLETPGGLILQSWLFWQCRTVMEEVICLTSELPLGKDAVWTLQLNNKLTWTKSETGKGWTEKELLETDMRQFGHLLHDVFLLKKTIHDFETTCDEPRVRLLALAEDDHPARFMNNPYIISPEAKVNNLIAWMKSSRGWRMSL